MSFSTEAEKLHAQEGPVGKAIERRDAARDSMDEDRMPLDERA